MDLNRRDGHEDGRDGLVDQGVIDTRQRWSELYSALLTGIPDGPEELMACQELLHSLMDSSHHFIFWKDLDSNFLGCNTAFSSFCGIDSSLLIGKSDADMPWADAPEFDSDWFIDWDKAVISDGEPRTGILEGLKRVDGEERWILTNKFPLRSTDGTLIGTWGFFEDITERNEAQEALQATLEDLDDRVNQRTQELTRAVETLRREVEDRVRLQHEERQQRTYAEALRETAAAISTSLELDEVAEQILSGVDRLVSNDLAALILVRDDDEYELTTHRSGFGYHASAIDALDLATLTVVEQLLDEPGSIILDDPGNALGPAQSVLGCRIRVGDQLIGFLIVESATAGFYSESHGDRLGAVAAQAGASVSNALFAGRVSELAAVEERQRLSMELHDAVNQNLWTAALTAETILGDLDDSSPLYNRIDMLRRSMRGALAEMRSLLLEMRSDDGELAETSLDAAISTLLDALEARRTLAVTRQIEPVVLGSTEHVTFFRVAQEALANVARHANARSVVVRLEAGPPARLVIIDDGVGFDTQAHRPGHFGLLNMQERAAAVGAVLTVSSSEGSGTRVEVRFEP